MTPRLRAEEIVMQSWISARERCLTRGCLPPQDLLTPETQDVLMSELIYYLTEALAPHMGKAVE